MNSDPITRWTEPLRPAGYRPREVLGAGMEGTVLALGDDLIAKIWHRRTPDALKTLKTFYDAVDQGLSGLRTPQIHEIIELDGQFATIESLLPGQPLQTATVNGEPVLEDEHISAIREVLTALAAVTPSPGMGVLPILEDEPPFDTEAVPFAHSLARLVERRVEKFRTPLAAHLPNLDALAAAVIKGLLDLPPTPSALLHGDLIPANILVDEDLRPTAVLDFGFLSTTGDPAFDAAITASIYNMYGPHAAIHEARVDQALADAFAYDPARLALYRAAYALTTSNCFSPTGTDGHFTWSLSLLTRPTTLDALPL
ncbi:phosphotransferase family protein [Kribbella deserti]|uniref:Phosphotransferase family protein n=1 Tax=Kribbella deserti TaxID=1926257 RepID=A0ABV6QHG7_9ACTN